MEQIILNARFWGEVLPWDDFAPLLKFSAPLLRTFAPPLITLLTKEILKDNYINLMKNYKM